MTEGCTGGLTLHRFPVVLECASFTVQKLCGVFSQRWRRQHATHEDSASAIRGRWQVPGIFAAAMD